MGIEHDEITMLSIDRKGKLLDKTLLDRLNVPAVYSIMDFTVSEDGMVAFGYVSENRAANIDVRGGRSKKIYVVDEV